MSLYETITGEHQIAPKPEDDALGGNVVPLPRRE
jgi:hypothetical protein